jgi:hypothetical protein
MSIELKIKSKHLALEPAIIKREEYKLLNQLKWYKQHHQITDIYRDEGANKLHHKWWQLTTHRKWDVRNEARATFLARAYLAGKPYKSVEAKTNDFPLLMTVIHPRIVDMVAKYGPNKIYKYHTPDKGRSYRPAEIAPIMDAITQWISKE